MNPSLIRALACELVLIVLGLLAAHAQNAPPDLLRKKLSEKISFDSTVFYNRYHDLSSEEPGATRLETDPPPEHLLVPTYLSDLLSVGLVGQNLLRNLHQEYMGPDLTVLPSLIRRSAYARITWRF